MAITYTEERNFIPQQVADLFLSVRWVVGKYPDRLYKALMNSSRVISAWDGDRLVVLFVSWMIASWCASSIMFWFILIIMAVVLLVIC